MREKLVCGDYVECVIGLAPNLFYNSPMEACIMICRMNKKTERKGKILFVNAISEVERKNAQSALTDDHIKKIADAYAGFENISGFAQVATTKDISENNYSLNIPLYVKPPVDAVEVDTLTIQEHYENWRSSSKRAHKCYQLLTEMIEKGGESNA